MGLIIVPTSDLYKFFRVEMRRESFYLTAEEIGRMFVYPLSSGASSDGTVELTYSDIPALRAALDLVEKELAERAARRGAPITQNSTLS